MTDEPIPHLARRLRDGSTSAEALWAAAAANYAATEDTLGAYRTWGGDHARAQARAADALFAAGTDLGPLQGVPISVKDIYGVAGLPVFAGAKRELPAGWRQEGPVVAALRSQAAVIVGKTHTVEFAFGGVGKNSHWGTPRNPWDAGAHRVSGGSSSGAGVSLLQGTAAAAFGTDTAGSVRIPASWTGTVGLKTTKGRWPTDGIVPLSRLYDTAGVLGRRVEDVAVVFRSIEARLRGRTAIERALPALPGAADIRVGIAEDWLWDGCGPGVAEAVKAALDDIGKAGGRLRAVDLPEAREAWAVFQEGGTSAAELRAFLDVELPDRLGELDPLVAARVLSAQNLPAVAFLARQRRLEHLAGRCAEHLASIDVLACPTVPIPPPTLAEIEDLDSYLSRNLACLRNTSVVNYLGLCALTLPVGLDAAGLPVGLQLIAAGGRDEALLVVGAALERALGDSAARLGRAPLARV